MNFDKQKSSQGSQVEKGGLVPPRYKIIHSESINCMQSIMLPAGGTKMKEMWIVQEEIVDCAGRDKKHS